MIHGTLISINASSFPYTVKDDSGETHHLTSRGGSALRDSKVGDRVDLEHFAGEWFAFPDKKSTSSIKAIAEGLDWAKIKKLLQEKPFKKQQWGATYRELLLGRWKAPKEEFWDLADEARQHGIELELSQDEYYAIEYKKQASVRKVAQMSIYRVVCEIDTGFTREKVDRFVEANSAQEAIDGLNKYIHDPEHPERIREFHNAEGVSAKEAFLLEPIKVSAVHPKVATMDDIISKAIEQLNAIDVLATRDEVKEAIDIVNHQTSGLIKLMKHARGNWGLTAKDAEKVVNIFAPLAHEALDFEPTLVGRTKPFNPNETYHHGDTVSKDGKIVRYCDSCGDWMDPKSASGATQWSNCPRCGKAWEKISSLPTIARVASQLLDRGETKLAKEVLSLSEIRYLVTIGPGQIHGDADDDIVAPAYDLGNKLSSKATNKAQHEFAEDPNMLAGYIGKDELIFGKVTTIDSPNIKVSSDGSVTTSFYALANVVLTPEEENNLKDYVLGQCSDGWGEGFEQRPIYGVYISTWTPQATVVLRKID